MREICDRIAAMSASISNNRMTAGNTIHIAAENPGKEPLFLQLVSLKSGKVIKEIPFDEKQNTGAVGNMLLNDIDIEKTGYRLRSGEEVFTDPYSFGISGNEKWGKNNAVSRFLPETEPEHECYQGNRPFSDLIIYYLHVRGFTKHKTSGVKAPGTFEGVVEKIPYFKGLNINALELMPCYDFNETIKEKEPESQEEAVRDSHIQKNKKRLNYWGFTSGNYFVPKNSFSATGDGIASFKDMIRNLHKEGIEVIADFYFEPSHTARFIVDVLRHWVVNYGVDGFALFGADIPIKDVLRDPYLRDGKFIFEKSPEESCPDYLSGDMKDRIAVLDQGFLYDNRRFLKSDADMLGSFARHLLEEGKCGRINYMASFNTLTMNDMVCYDRKHNEENGENNTDGSDNNFSWNCGVEGRSRRKAVLALRDRQIRNAFIYLMLSRGTPRILMGDEFRNSQKGNNNPYCLDSPVTWLNWEDEKENSSLTEFVRTLTALRNENPIFRHAVSKKAGRYPETSFHGEMAWQAMFHDYFRHIGVMYSGDQLYYCAYNMHWQVEKLALPKSGKDMKWGVIINTNNEKKNPVINEGFIHVPPRSVVILKAST